MIVFSLLKGHWVISGRQLPTETTVTIAVDSQPHGSETYTFEDAVELVHKLIAVPVVKHWRFEIAGASKGHKK